MATTILFSSNSNRAFYEAMRKENISIPRIVGGFKLRWRQLKHSGSGLDEWMIDQVIVSQALQTGPAWVCCGKDAFGSSTCFDCVKNTRPLLSENATVVSNAFDTCSPSLSAWKLTNAKQSNRCGSVGTQAIVFSGSGTRSMTLGPLALPHGADLVFFHKLGDGGEAVVR
jgi:hypothetical protein